MLETCDRSEPLDPILTKSIEQEAVLRCQQGDREAFRRVLDFHGDHLYRVALLITRDASLAEEAVQESLLAAWKKIRSFKAGTDLRAWLNRILINCIGMMQRRKRLPTTAVEEALPLADSGIGPEQSALNAEAAAMLQSALRNLSVEHRTVLVLKYFNEMTVPEIAESTGWKRGTVMSRLHRAMAALRDAVAASEGLDEPRLSGEEAQS